MVELTTQYFSHSSKSEVLLPFQHRMFLCDVHTVRYNLILFTDFKIETDQIMKQPVLRCNGRTKDVFRELSRAPDIRQAGRGLCITVL